MVAPLVGAWIEILYQSSIVILYTVAPLVGAWIEICTAKPSMAVKLVAPLVGAWIEIVNRTEPAHVLVSLPSWERGLK